MKPTLLILAAGMASRYGSMKQIEGFGPSGETIMDYSIYDAIRAGFGKVVFIIRNSVKIICGISTILIRVTGSPHQKNQLLH